MNSSIIEVGKDYLRLTRGVEINVAPLKAKLASYLELLDRIIVRTWTAVDIRKEKPGYNLYRNIFCYAKSDGRQLWQIEQAYDHRTHEPLEEVYKYIALHIKDDEEDRWLSIEENGSVEVEHRLPDGSEVGGQVYLKPFRPGKDRLSTMTLSQFPNEYWIDYETGKVEWFAIHQKI